jgi:phenylglyoxylate dehydrogenase epsilon subunit
LDPERIFLRDQDYFDRHKVTFKQGRTVNKLDTTDRKAITITGEEIAYEKLLIATGATPVLPNIPGLKESAYHVLRVMDDASTIRQAMQKSSSAIVLGAGLIGLHAAENLAQAGTQVTVVEKLPQVLPGYFDEQAAGMIKDVFTQKGINILTGSQVTRIVNSKNTCTVALENGPDLSADLLLVATGVRTRMELVANSGIAVDSGILVDDHMRTNIDNVWAAGDVAQARSFWGSQKVLNGILPDAVEQGWIAGMAMADDPALTPYTGGIAMNTFNFFGQRAFSVGLTAIPQSDEALTVDLIYSPNGCRYQKLVFRNDNLIGVAAINCDLDPGVMWKMIHRQVELGDTREDFVRAPLEVGRTIMSSLWQ